MKRRIIEIDENKCNGCGACAAACHEGTIAMVDGKAKLMRDDYCDGLGDCLPACPTGAITFVEREAAAYDEQAVMENKQRKMRNEGMTLPCGCPGSQSRNIQRQEAPVVETPQAQQTSRLSQWPVQIKLVPVNAPYFDGARLLIAADCTAYAYAAFHERFIKGHITLVGCPKLDSVDYSEKLTEIIRENNIKSVTVARSRGRSASRFPSARPPRNSRCTHTPGTAKRHAPGLRTHIPRFSRSWFIPPEFSLRRGAVRGYSGLFCPSQRQPAPTLSVPHVLGTRVQHPPTETRDAVSHTLFPQ